MKNFHISIDKYPIIYYNTLVFENKTAKHNGEEVAAISHKYALTQSAACGRAGVYGVEIKTSDGKSVCYPYISSSREVVERLIDRLERGDVSDAHAQDIVRDYITALYIEKLQINGLY